MSDRVPLRDYRNSRAVLIGTWMYRNLGPVPAAANSLRRMTGLLTSELCGWPADRITRMRDEAGPGDLHERLIRLFRDVADVAVFYYVGHGQIDDNDQLCLGLVDSSEEPDLRESTSLPFSRVRDAMLRSPASTKILILDCCFSGLAGERRNTLGASDIADQAGGAGAYTMAACHAYGTASFEMEGANPQTYFTKYLVDVIEAGIPGQPAGLRLHPIFQQLSERLEADGRPRPMERNINFGSEFVFAYNAAPVQVEIDVTTALQRLEKRIAQLEGSFAKPAEEAPSRLPDSGHAADSASGVGPAADCQRASEEPEPVARLREQGASLLRANRGQEFRAVEAQLERLGSSARPAAVLQTSFGAITIQLLPDYAPEAVRNFIELAEGTRPWLDPRHREPLRRGVRLYDSTVFHRVISGLMIQGGDPIGTGYGGPGYLQALELHKDLSFDRPYVVAMANSGPNSDGSQFFITVRPAPWLTYKHTIFGLVIDGSSVADRISEVPADSNYRPIDDVVLKTVHISGDLTSHS